MINTQQFIERCTKIHNNKYDYSKSIYTKNKEPLIIICPQHGEFLQLATKHLRKHGCVKCGGSNRLTNEEFIHKSNIKHSNKYDYSMVNYKNNTSIVTIICKNHGKFEQQAAAHLSGKGCLQCHGRERFTLYNFIKKSNEKHNFIYDYSNIINVKYNIKVNIICKTHGTFLQQPYSHMSGKGCPKCSTCISNMETSWLDSLNLDIERQKKLNINNKFTIVDDLIQLLTQFMNFMVIFGMEIQKFIIQMILIERIIKLSDIYLIKQLKEN